MRQASGFATTLALVLALAACSDALEQTTSAGQVVASVNAVSRSISLVSVDDRSVTSVPMAPPGATPLAAAALGSLLTVPATDSAAVPLFDFTNGRPGAVIRLPLYPNSGAPAITVDSDSVAWVVSPSRNLVTRIRLKTGDTASFGTGVFPQAVVTSGGLVYIVNGNLTGGNPAGPSWITVRIAATGALAPIDSIPLSGLNARFATHGGDGLIYVVDAGRVGKGDGKLSIVDPRAATEQLVLNGLGESPGAAVYHPSGRLLVASRTEGILEINVVTRVLLRGPGNGIKPAGQGVAALALDERGRVYALDQGNCTQPGTMSVLSAPPDYDLEQQVTVGVCPTAAVTMLVP